MEEWTVPRPGPVGPGVSGSNPRADRPGACHPLSSYLCSSVAICVHLCPVFLEAPMQLGFVSAILPDLNLDEVLAFASDEGFACVELMCWPPGGADRRYAGVTHLDVTSLTDEAAGRVRDLVKQSGVAISGL